MEVELPHKDLHTFNGTLFIDAKTKFSYSQDQLLLKGANLANTEWAVGVVVFLTNVYHTPRELPFGLLVVRRPDQQR